VEHNLVTEVRRRQSRVEMTIAVAEQENLP